MRVLSATLQRKCWCYLEGLNPSPSACDVEGIAMSCLDDNLIIDELIDIFFCFLMGYECFESAQIYVKHCIWTLGHANVTIVSHSYLRRLYVETSPP